MKKSYIILFVLFLLFLNKSLYADISECIDYFNKGKYKESFNACSSLALAGDTDALNHIAMLNLFGKGVEKNINKAINLYKIAAEENNSQAQNNLGNFYYKGKIIEQDLVEAAFWYYLASQEYSDLIKKVENIKKQLNKFEISKLNEKLDNWERFGFDEPQEIDLSNIPLPSEIPNTYRITGSGSGFFVTSYGELLTNYHVVDGCRAITVIINNKRYSAKIINYEYDKDKIDKDLALLKINFFNQQHATFQNYPVKLGQQILVSGYPLFDIFESLQTTPGIISSLSAWKSKNGIQFTAPIQPGNSGGPIFSNKGRVLGVVVASSQNLKMMELIGEDKLPQNLNFGIKNKIIKNFLSRSTKNHKVIKDKKILDTEELADLAKIVTRPIECWK